MGANAARDHPGRAIAPPIGANPPDRNDQPAKSRLNQWRVGLLTEQQSAVHLHVGFELQQAVVVDGLDVVVGPAQRAGQTDPTGAGFAEQNLYRFKAAAYRKGAVDTVASAL